MWLLGPGLEHWNALQGMGLRTVGDLHVLPRTGLARRFGAALLNELDRALGDAPDPRVAIVLPPVFESRLELFARADTTEQVLHGASLLLARLVLWLAAQHAFVRRFTLLMQHEARRPGNGSDAARTTELEIALAEPSRDPSASKPAGGIRRWPNATISSPSPPTVPWYGSTVPGCRCRPPKKTKGGSCKVDSVEVAPCCRRGFFAPCRGADSRFLQRSKPSPLLQGALSSCYATSNCLSTNGRMPPCL